MKKLVVIKEHSKYSSAPRKPCSWCGKGGRIEVSYSRPLDITKTAALCNGCITGIVTALLEQNEVVIEVKEEDR